MSFPPTNSIIAHWSEWELGVSCTCNHCITNFIRMVWINASILIALVITKRMQICWCDLSFCFHGTDRFFHCLQTLVGCGLSGPTSPLAFAEAVLGAISPSAASSLDKEKLWKMWNTVVYPLTDTITQVGGYVTLTMNPSWFNGVKCFCDERLWVAAERPKLNSKS